MRRIAVVASGSLGDVRPYAMLAAAFARAGWNAGLVANDGYRGLASTLRSGWFAPAMPPLETVMAWQERQNRGDADLFDARLWDPWFAAYPALIAALAGADVVVSRIPFVGDIAGALDIPFVHAANTPAPALRADVPRVARAAAIGAMTRRRRALRPIPGAVAALNLASHLGAVPDRLALLLRERRSIGHLLRLQHRHRAAIAAAVPGRLPARPARPHLRVTGLSRHVIPPRRGEIFTGLWRTPSPEYAPDAALGALLSPGKPAVSIGFGSVPCMPDGRDFGALSRLVADAAQQAGVRVVLGGGWGGLRWPHDRDPADAVVANPPHEWLFARVGAAVHHCGIGTTVTAMASGIPQVAVPFLQDQPFWAWRAHELGVSPPPLDPARLTADALANAIRTALHDGALRARAAALGAALRAEDGLARTVDLVEHALASAPPLAERIAHGVT